MTYRILLRSKVGTDDSKLLRESNLTRRQPRRAPRHVTSYRQLLVKDLAKVPTWRQEWD